MGGGTGEMDEGMARVSRVKYKLSPGILPGV